MKKSGLFLAVIIAALVGFSTAHAQTTSGLQFSANIPFKFNVGDRTLPAGRYSVRCINPSSDVKVLQLRSVDGKWTAVVNTSSVVGRMNKDTRLVFNRYGTRYYFAQAWLVSERVGMQAVKSQSERTTATATARLAGARETIALTTKP